MAITKIKINNPSGQEPSIADIGAEGINVTFSNTGTTLQSTNVDAAIKEVNGNIPTVSTAGRTGSYNDLIDTPELAAVATSGSYEDLDDQPNIPVVEANPAGTASGTLTSLKVDNTIYGISGGSSGGDSVSWNQVVQSGTKIAEVTINSTTTDVYAPSGSGGASALGDLTDVTLTTPTNGQIIKYDSTNQIWVNANESGGSTVIANPSGSATEDLIKIQIGNNIYSIPSGESSGSGYTETILYSANDTASTYALSQAFTNFDLIMCIGKSNYDNKNYFITNVFQIDALESGIGDNTYRYAVTNDSWYSYFSVNTTTEFIRQDQSQMFLYKIIGIKFNNSSGKGHWLDLTSTLTAGSTTVTFTNPVITTASTFDFYTDTFGVNPIAVVATNGNITLTFEAQQSNVGVKVRVTTDGTPSGSGNGNGNITINSSTIVDISQVI